ncbi:hypothetical protein EVAR_93936_1 [Eumeta japonica]|uniref:Phosphatidylinositol transfer protein N-terminal domain-containing protein n=1 Tax=Eumeta variegata TaxID=151549 RepID=A0A4C1TP50_EUMVA|nr:hypothetical protein EVAR_93936_1 [Eumeta japonica]
MFMQVHELSVEKLKIREAANIDIERCRQRTGDAGRLQGRDLPSAVPLDENGPRTAQGAVKADVEPVMTCYKFVIAEFKRFGLAAGERVRCPWVPKLHTPTVKITLSKVENLIQRSKRRPSSIGKSGSLAFINRE